MELTCIYEFTAHLGSHRIQHQIKHRHKCALDRGNPAREHCVRSPSESILQILVAVRTGDQIRPLLASPGAFRLRPLLISYFKPNVYTSVLYVPPQV